MRWRLEALWRPHPSLATATEQQRARLAAGLLLALMALGAAALALPEQEPAQGTLGGTAILLLALAALLGAYLLVRAGHLRSGVVLTIAALEGAVWLNRFGTPVRTEGQGLMYLALPILLAGILLDAVPALAVAAATVVGGVALEASLDQRLGAVLDQEDLTLAVFLLAVAVVAVVGSALMQRQARALEESSQQLRQLTDNLPEVFFIVSPDAATSYYASPAYEALWGRPVQGFLDDAGDWLKGVHPDDLPHVQRTMADPPKGGMEFRVVHPSGAVRHMRSRTFPVLADGKVVRLVGLSEDVTEVRKAQDQVREAQAQRIRLLQQLAHDLGSPLTPLKIQARLLANTLPPEQQRPLAIITRNVEHLQRLVEDVKDVARLEGGDLKVAPQPADLAQLARQAVETLQASAQQRQVALALRAPAAAPAQVDPGRITQILYNLVGNALKFTPPGGRVDVTLDADGGRLRLRVADTGPGMAPEQLARLFRPFVQVHDPASVRNPEDKGSGLGLFISQGIVRAHGGTLQAASDGPGKGSTFTVELPAPPAALSAAPA